MRIGIAVTTTLLLVHSPLSARAQVLEGACAPTPSGALGVLLEDLEPVLDGATSPRTKTSASKVTAGFSVTKGSTKYSASETTAVELTCAGVTVEQTAEVKVAKTASGKSPSLFGAKLSGEAGAGFSTTSKLTAPLPQACELLGELPPAQHGELAAACGGTCGANAGACDGFATDPTIFSPETIPDGGTLVITDSAFAYASGSVSIPLHRVVSLEIGQSVKSGVSYSAAVTREGCLVTVTIGPTEFIETALKLGLKLGGDLSGLSLAFGPYVELSDRHEESALLSYRFDVCTPEGRAAYDGLLRDGTVPPAWKPTKIVIESDTSTRSAGVEGSVEGGGVAIEIGVELLSGSNAAARTVTTAPDGSVTVAISGNVGDNHFVLTQPPSGCPTFVMTVKGMSPDAAQAANGALCGDPYGRFSGDQDFTLRFSCDDWKVWRDRACAYTKEAMGPASMTWEDVCAAESLPQFARALTHVPATSIGYDIASLVDGFDAPDAPNEPLPAEVWVTPAGTCAGPSTTPGRRCR